MCAVDGHVVSDGHVVADFDGGALVERVQDAAVLDVHIVCQCGCCSRRRATRREPDATVVADDYISHHCRIFRKIAVFAYLGREAPYGFYQCHKSFFFKIDN